MSERSVAKGSESENATSAVTAGSLLREARRAQGLHIAALAAAIKVTPRKLELLESDRIDELPDATFARALAQTVCRTLRCDPTPVLALLPRSSDQQLERVSEGLNTPFRERPGRLVPKDWTSLASPAVWVPAVVLLAAAGLYLLPAGSLPLSQSGPRAASEPEAGAASAGTAPLANAAPAASEPTAEAALSGEGSASLPASVADAPAEAASAPPVLAAETGVAAPAATGLLQLQTTAPSWIGIIDARGQTLLSRVVQPGEALGFDGAMPLKVTIGNANATALVVRGKALDFAAFTRDNVARLEVK